ncbi:DNA-binding response OmpR family regulator [Actinocorallia herbida]|uniref:DNA-binding response OmpR family regulator n=1 Tax=Actinocorallia herbida TaxID=58109 RepID=A0A3N1CS56_9ACTN|nr:response regulator transcription factor [Actinocorallia herbida]ROO84004.1 DNA-binding response OmpR family regulator [Actinocorallia herbida]
MGGEGATISTVLVFEHDPDVAELERLYLAREGYAVVVEQDRSRPAAAVVRVRPDVVVVDLSEMPPAVTAAELYRRVAEAARPAPVIRVLPQGRTVEAGEQAVVRPFSPRALVSAVGAALRAHAEDTAADVLRAGALVLDPRTRSVRAGERPATLTATEFDLLAHLLRHPGRVFTREQLLAAAWSPGGGAGVRTVDVHVAQLRAKLGQASPIRTVRGVGYAADV